MYRSACPVRFALFAVVALAAFVSPPAAQAFDWEAPVRISDDPATQLAPRWQPPVYPQADMTGDGKVVAAWDAHDPDFTDSSGVRSAARTAAGGWAAPQGVAGRTNQFAIPKLQDLVVEPDGDAIALYVELNPTSSKPGLYAKFRPAATGVWSVARLVTLNEAGEPDSAGTSLAVDGSGNAVVFYHWRADSGPAKLQRADWNSNTTGGWTNTTVVTAPGAQHVGLYPEFLDMNSAGDAVMLARNTEDYDLHAFTKQAGGGWSGDTPLRVGEDENEISPYAVGVDPDGDIRVIAKACAVGGNDPYCVKELVKPAGGTWSGFTEVPGVASWLGDAVGQFNDATIADDGKAIIALTRDPAGPAPFEQATISGSGSSWGTPQVFHTAPSEVSVAWVSANIAPDGTEHVAWVRGTGDGNTHVSAARRPAGGAFEGVRTIASSSSFMAMHALLVSTSGPPTIVFEKDDQLWATRGGVFALPTRSLTVTKNGSGTVTAAGISCDPDCSESYPQSSGVTLQATAAAGWNFTGWTGCDSISGGQCVVAMNVSRQVTATFTAQSGGGTDTGTGTGTGTPTPTGTEQPATTGSQTGTAGGLPTGTGSGQLGLGGLTAREQSRSIAGNAKPGSGGTLTLSGITSGGALSVRATAVGASSRAVTAAAMTVFKVRKSLAPGSFSLKVKPTAAAKRRLKRKTKLKIKLSVTFSPIGGTAATTTRTLTLRYRP